MEEWIISIVEQFGYVGIFLMIALENIFPPIPSEVILTFGGMMTILTNLSIIGVVISATIGSVLGAIILYQIGNLIDIHQLEKIVDRYGRFLKITRQDIYKAYHWFDHYGFWTVFFCRFVPLIRSLISIPAGMSKMKLPLFLLLTTAGTFVWNIVLVTLGAKFGESWDTVVSYMDIYSKFVYLIIGLLLMTILLFLFIRRRKV